MEFHAPLKFTTFLSSIPLAAFYRSANQLYCLNRYFASFDHLNVLCSMFNVQLNLALTNFRGPIIFFFYTQNSVIANKEKKCDLFERTMNLHVIGGIPLVAGPLERGSTVCV